MWDFSDSLLLLDELGPREAEAAAAETWPEILAHPEVLLFHITEQNRNDEKLILWIRSFFFNYDK